MKRVIAITIVLLALGGTGKATILCARLLCPEQAQACCCCQDASPTEQPTIRMAMDCGLPADGPQAPDLRAESNGCCTVSSPPQKPAHEVRPKLSANTLKLDHKDQISHGPPGLPELTIQPATSSLIWAVPYLDRSDIYLLVETLRL
jgi:hypothetical protein